jgi:glycine cleavage system H protein
VSEIPPDLHYTAEHEWVRRTGADTAGEAFGEVESTKSVSDLYAPVSAKVLAVNEDLDASPELVNSDPYGGGWLLDLQVEAAALEKGFAELLDAEAYRSTLAE